MPRTPYLPPGTLREVLAYPSTPQTFAADAYERALLRLKLDRLVPVLDQAQRWDRELTEDEQQGLAFARLVLHAPPWVLIDEALDTLDDDVRQNILEILAKDLAGTGVVHIGREENDEHFFAHVLHLIKDPALRRLPSAPTPVVA
jgi:vitamin B12/bleomycin/antimicrobial peptide transport system ATP-binding/permease protein